MVDAHVSVTCPARDGGSSPLLGTRKLGFVGMENDADGLVEGEMIGRDDEIIVPRIVRIGAKVLADESIALLFYVFDV